MAVLCVCGVCVPYSILWPVLLLFLKPIIDSFRSFFGLGKQKCEEKAVDCCSGGSQRLGTYNLGSTDAWSDIKNGSKLTFVRFTATWCLPCKKIEPVFICLGAENPLLSFVSIDVDEFDEIAAAYSAVKIPLFLAIQGGTVLGRMSGQDEKTLRQFVQDTKDKTNLTKIGAAQLSKLE